MRTITAVGTTGATGTGITLDAPLSRAHANARYVEGSRAGTSTHDDTQGSDARLVVHAEGRARRSAKAMLHTGAGATCRSCRPAPGETLTRRRHRRGHAVPVPPPDARRATFDSDNPTLNDVLDLMQHSAIHSSEETFLDTPTREKGQFTGDTGGHLLREHGRRRRSQRDQARDPRDPLLRHPLVEGDLAAATASASVPCSFRVPSARPGRVNAVYPNGDNMRDIPDYTEFVPGWVLRYYQQSGDASRAQLAAMTR